MRDGRTPAAEGFARQRERNHVRVFREQRVYRAAQMANAFAVNDPYAQNAPRAALGEIICDEVLHLARLERVQVQHAINRKFNRFVND